MTRRLKVSSDVHVKRMLISTKKMVTSRFLGNYQSVFRGRGLEFDGYREYTVNDDASLIDWKASLRSGTTVVKEFVEERNLTVFFLIDAGSNMLLGSTERLKSEFAAEFVGALSFAVLNSGDSVGFSLFSGKPTFQSPPRTGLKEYYRLLNALTDTAYYGGKLSIKQAATFLFHYVEEGAVIVFISDFLQREPWEEEMKILAQKFDIICVMISDPLDVDIPKGMGFVRVKDPFSDRTLLVEPNAVAQRYHEEARRHAASLREQLERIGADFLPLDCAKPFAKPLLEFFELRARKWR